MNQKGILLESLLLVLIAIIANTVVSNSQLANQERFTGTTRDYYDLTTKWQNTRFLLEQETSNWIIEQIIADLDCQYAPAQPDLHQALDSFNNAESNIECTASFGVLQNETNFPILLSCIHQNPNGETTVFSKSFTIAKHIESNGTSPNCDILIKDWQSGEIDYQIP